MAALAAEPRLERHEDPRRVAVACDALAQHQLDPGDHAPTEAQVLGQRPFRQRCFEAQPQRSVVLVLEPCGAMGGLEAYERQEGGRVVEVREEVLRGDQVQHVVHGKIWFAVVVLHTWQNILFQVDEYD